jgi:hypothetical protein
MTVFSDVKALLDAQIAAWSAQRNGQVPNLIGRHGDPSFKWDTLADLKAAKVVKRGVAYPLLDVTKIGQKGEGAKMNLIVALSSSTGVNNFGQMPDQGPFMSGPNIKIISDWIDAGCPQ